ncbi:MAG TPA: metal-dependent transcriptional regulator [Acidimicrobiales bacterium]
MTATDSVENYLKTIYVLEARSQVTTTLIAGHLHVASPSVSAMVKKLVAEGLVRHAPYQEVRLTRQGQAAARRVVRRHRLIETYLHEALGIPWDEVHDEAEVLEHCVSDRVEDAMDSALGHPSRDPHGDPIPPKKGRHDEVADEPLASIQPGTTVRLERVSDRDPAVLRHLAGLAVLPGIELVVEARDPFGGPTWVRAGGQRHPLGSELVGAMFVSVVSR